MTDLMSTQIDLSTCPEEFLLSDSMDAYLDRRVEQGSRAIKAAQISLACPRTIRVIKAIWNGPVMREELDRIAGSSNSPDIVFRLRNCGKDLEIPCVRIDSKDIDGKRCRPGRYEFTKEDKSIIAEWLGLQ